MKNLTSVLFLTVLTGCAVADLSMKNGFRRGDVKTISVKDFSVAPGAGGEKSGRLAAQDFRKELSALGFVVLGTTTVQNVTADAIVTGSVSPALESGHLVVPPPEPPPKPEAKKRPEIVTSHLSVSANMTRVDTGELLWVGHAESEGSSVESSIRAAVRMIAKRIKLALFFKR